MAKRSEGPITFCDWIDQQGMADLARKLNVHYFTVRHWRAGRHDPQVRHIRAIKKLSRGKLSYDSIIDSRMSKRAD